MSPRAWVVLALATPVVAVLALAFGAAELDFRELIAALTGRGSPEALVIVRELRLPRLLLAAAVGAALSAAGATLQVTLANPLAEPWLLGVSGGAAVGAVGALALGAEGIVLLSLCAFGGAMGAVALILLLARAGGTAPTPRLLMAGVVTGTFANAVIMVALADAPPTAQRSALWWMMGSVAYAQWRDVAFMWGALALVGAALVHGARALDAIGLGSETAASLGVDPERTVRRTFVLASLLAAATVATAGLVGFVGLIVPHLARGLVRRGGVRPVLVASALLGAPLLILADLAARVARPPLELPLGAITALCGVPFFLRLLRKAR